MSKKILVLTGSPRKNGNSDMMADAFIAGAEKAGHQVTKIKTADMSIKGCLACNKCFSKGKACIVDDGFNDLALLLDQNDVLVLIAPIYWYSFPTQLKAAMDKLYSFLVAGKPLAFKEMALLACGEDTAEDMFDGIAGSFKSIVKFLKLTDRGQVLVPGVLNEGDIKNTDGLTRAEALGAAM